MLNDQQRAVVDHAAGPLLVLAVPGAGKTRCIVHRVAQLLERGERPETITLLTFTRKAAGEMKERLEHMLGQRLKGLFSGTFHGFAYRFLKQELSGEWSKFAVVEDARRQLARLMKQTRVMVSVGEAARLIGLAQQRLLSPDTFLEMYGADSRLSDVGRLYRAYDQWKHEEHRLDYGDFVPTVLWLLEDPQRLGRWRMKTKNLLVDEGHDIGYDQLQLVYRLAGNAGNVTLVADGDQSIYAFRGADPQHLHDFRTHFPAVTTITLGENFRSTPQILHHAKILIDHNPNRDVKPLATRNQAGPPIALSFPDDVDAEAVGVARGLVGANGQGTTWGECAVLYRTNAQSAALETALYEAEVPFTIVGNQTFYELPEVRDLLCYLRVLNNPQDETALFRILNVPPRSLGAAFQEALHSLSARRGISPYHLLGSDGFPKPYMRPSSQRLKDSLEYLRRDVGHVSIGALLRSVVQISGYRDWIERESENMPDNEQMRNVEELTRVAERWHDLGQFLRYTIAVTNASKGAGNRVSLMTLHKSKGLEFEYVHLVGLAHGTLPHERALAELGGLEEERRLCYVGMTRAKRRLVLSAPRVMWKKEAQPSQFLVEADLVREEES